MRESRVVYPVKSKPPKPSSRRRVFLISGAIGLFILLALAGYAARLPALAVERVEVMAGGGIPADEIQRSVLASIAGRWAFLIPRNNYFAVSKDRIEADLRKNFPEVAAVRVNKEFPNRLAVEASGRRLWGVYCERPFRSAPPAACAYLDAQGLAYEELTGFGGWLLPVMYGPLPIELGAIVVPPALLEFFNQAEGELSSLGGSLLSLTFSTTTPDEVRLDLAEGWHLSVTPSRPVGEWLGVLETVLAKDIGARRGELEYVDLRFGAKVFYKFRN